MIVTLTQIVNLDLSVGLITLEAVQFFANSCLKTFSAAFDLLDVL